MITAMDMIDNLREEIEEEVAIRERLAKILTDTAIAIKGEEPPLTRHSWHDLEQCANDVVKERNALRQKLSSLLQDLHVIKDQCSLWGGEATRAGNLLSQLLAAFATTEPKP